MAKTVNLAKKLATRLRWSINYEKLVGVKDTRQRSEIAYLKSVVVNEVKLVANNWKEIKTMNGINLKNKVAMALNVAKETKEWKGGNN